jgi:hypothetical protein
MGGKSPTCSQAEWVWSLQNPQKLVIQTHKSREETTKMWFSSRIGGETSQSAPELEGTNEDLIQSEGNKGRWELQAVVDEREVALTQWGAQWYHTLWFLMTLLERHRLPWILVQLVASSDGDLWLRMTTTKTVGSWWRLTHHRRRSPSWQQRQKVPLT